MSVTPPLVSERDEMYAPGWRDCTYASAMMAAFKAGFRAFPLGLGKEEREALERSDSRPDETGGNVTAIDEATQNRYGFKLQPITSAAAASAFLRGPATSGALVSINMYLAPSWQKRWDPAFCSKNPANHAVYVQPTGDGQHVLWLDPEATWGYSGDIITAEAVEAMSLGYWNMRLAPEGLVAPPPPPPSVTLKYGGYEGYRGTWRINQNYSRFRSSPYLLTTNILGSFGPTSSGLDGYLVNGQFSNAQTTDQGDYVNGSRRWLGDSTGTKWIHVSLVTLVK